MREIINAVLYSNNCFIGLFTCFFIALILFGFFIAGENIARPVSRWEKLIAQPGLWQRLSLAMMYLSYVVLGFYIEAF